MSVLFGVLKKRGGSAGEAGLRDLSAATQRYATGGGRLFIRGRIGMGLQLYRSHLRSAMDERPFADDQGNIICFDGRLDNFRELAKLLRLDHAQVPDSMIVLAAFEQWDEACFAKLTGDWALALWDEREQQLFLARDHAGTRSLYFAHSREEMHWATYLDTFTASAVDLKLSRAYAAAFLSSSPVRDLTPYAEIRAVRPGHYVVLRDGRISQNAHWSPLVRTSIRYKAEADYDNQFLSIFGSSVARRTGPGEPVLAQLSGGMDSTAIVCMSDHMRRAEDSHAEILDTISFFDDSEASLDERRHFLITEQRRGKSGTHLDIPASERTYDLPSETIAYQTPGCDDFSLRLEHALFKLIWERGYRSVLSGIGGDEVLGGVPNGLPELANYLVFGRFGRLMQRAIAWSLPDRTPLLSTLRDTTKYTFRLYTQSNPKRRPLPAWLSSRTRDAFMELEQTMDVLPNRIGAAPHQLENALTWWHIMETLPHLSPQTLFRPEYQYPMLDKDLVEFLFAIPPEQLVRPGRRRALMRRALRGIMPPEILERRRKAYRLHASMSAIRAAHHKLERLIKTSMAAELGFIEVDAFTSALQATVNGEGRWYQAILRTIAYELWLRMRARRNADLGLRTVHSSLAAP